MSIVVAQIVVQCPPGKGRINGRFNMAWSPKRPHVRPRLCTTADYRTYTDEVAIAAAQYVARTGVRFRGGRLAIAIVEHWPQLDHKTPHLNGDHPLGDWDAPIKATCDGLAHGGMIDTDARIVEGHVRKRYDPRNPRVAVAVWALPDRD